MTGTDHGHDPELHRLLHDAVDDIHPHEGISAIRARTRKEKEKAMPARRSTLLGAAGAALAVAAVIGVVVGTGALDSDDEDDRSTPVATSSPSASVDDPVTTEPTQPAPSESEEPAGGHAIAVYYLSDAGRGPVLFREFRRSEEPDHGLADEVGALMTVPLDPDYRTVWQPGDLASAEFDDEVVRVTIGDAALRDRPVGMSRAEAKASVQQVVYTMQAAVGQRAPVQFVLDDNPVDQVLGVPTSEPLTNSFEVLSLMNITSPSEGATVSGTFTATGVNNGFEAWVGYQVLKGDEVVAEGFGTAEGWMEEKLFAWEVEVDVSGLEPGEYVLRFHNDDPSGGAEGNGPDEDTRTIVVE